MELQKLKRILSLKVNWIYGDITYWFLGINWETLRKQQAPIIPETKGESDTNNFVRMSEKITQEEKSGPFGFTPKDKRSASNVVSFF